MEFRKAQSADIDEIVRILKCGSARLRACGVDQWQRGYPDRGTVEADVASGVGMALCDEGGDMAAYGAVIFSGEAAYDDITGGGWLTDGPYAVVHRLCVAERFLGRGCGVGFMRRAEEFVSGRAASIRIDTHPDNMIMQGLLRRTGFTYCGDVVIESRRLAFEKILTPLAAELPAAGRACREK